MYIYKYKKYLYKINNKKNQYGGDVNKNTGEAGSGAAAYTSTSSNSNKNNYSTSIQSQYN